MDRPRQLSAVRFLGMFVGVVVLFVATTIYAQFVQRQIDQAALSIASTTSPGIEHLLKAQAELRHLQTLAHGYVATGDEPRWSPEIAAARRVLAQEIWAYRALPVFRGEAGLAENLAAAVADFERSLDAMLAWARQGDLDRAAVVLNGQLTHNADRATVAIAAAVEFNAAWAQELAETIEHIRRRSMVIEGALSGVSAVVAVFAGLVLLRAVRQYTRLLEEHGRLQEERADELEQFAGRVAHDILSPLGAVSMSIVLAEKRLPEDAAARQPLGRGQRSLERVRGVVDSLLDFARAGARPQEGARADVAEVVADLMAELQPIAEDRRIELQVDPFPPCAVATSAGILTSALGNLLRNALKYIGDAPERRVRVSVQPRAGRVRVEVADTGPGIPPELHRLVFEPYVRGPDPLEPGIGLGLATVKRVVESHGGRVGVQSIVGQGSVFWFDLPEAPELPPTTPGAA